MPTMTAEELALLTAPREAKPQYTKFFGEKVRVPDWATGCFSRLGLNMILPAIWGMLSMSTVGNAEEDKDALTRFSDDESHKVVIGRMTQDHVSYSERLRAHWPGVTGVKFVLTLAASESPNCSLPARLMHARTTLRDMISEYNDRRLDLLDMVKRLSKPLRDLLKGDLVLKDVESSDEDSDSDEEEEWSAEREDWVGHPTPPSSKRRKTLEEIGGNAESQQNVGTAGIDFRPARGLGTEHDANINDEHGLLQAEMVGLFDRVDTPAVPRATAPSFTSGADFMHGSNYLLEPPGGEVSSSTTMTELMIKAGLAEDYQVAHRLASELRCKMRAIVTKFQAKFELEIHIEGVDAYPLRATELNDADIAALGDAFIRAIAVVPDDGEDEEEEEEEDDDDDDDDEYVGEEADDDEE